MKLFVLTSLVLSLFLAVGCLEKGTGPVNPAEIESDSATLLFNVELSREYVDDPIAWIWGDFPAEYNPDIPSGRVVFGHAEGTTIVGEYPRTFLRGDYQHFLGFLIEDGSNVVPEYEGLYANGIHITGIHQDRFICMNRLGIGNHEGSLTIDPLRDDLSSLKTVIIRYRGVPGDLADVGELIRFIVSNSWPYFQAGTWNASESSWDLVLKMLPEGGGDGTVNGEFVCRPEGPDWDARVMGVSGIGPDGHETELVYLEGSGWVYFVAKLEGDRVVNMGSDNRTDGLVTVTAGKRARSDEESRQFATMAMNNYFAINTTP